MNRYASPSSRLQVGEQVEDLRLDRTVERGDRFVEHEQLGLARRARGRCRSVGVAHRTARAGSAPRARGRGRRARTPRAPASPISRERPAICSGSATIARAVMRGSSDEYGSWNTICTRRRIARKRAPRQVRDVVAVDADRPRDGSSSRTTRRATVDLPLPDSPTSPRVSPAASENDTSSTACTASAARGELLDQAVDLEQRAHDRPRPGRHLVGEEARGAVALAQRAQLGHRAPDTRPRPADSAGWNAHPDGSAVGIGRVARDRGEHRPRASSARGTDASSPRVYG